MAVQLFSTEYKYQKDLVSATNYTFNEPLKQIMISLRGLMTDDGFTSTFAPHLDSLRHELKRKEREKILTAVGADKTSKTAPTQNQVLRAAAIKFLRHVYMVQKKGGHEVWVFSSPKIYNGFPSNEFYTYKDDAPAIQNRLDASEEIFSKKQKNALGVATTLGLAWCHKTIMVLTTAQIKPQSNERQLVKKWFAGPATTEVELNKYIGILQAGFRKIIATISSHKLVFTDMPSLRTSTNTDDKALLAAYAFVYAGNYEKIPIIYIENAFFAKNNTPIPSKQLWTITVIHEITHLDISTKDHKYDYAGLEPGVKITPAQAIENADSWAYFCADCAKALSKSNILSVMKGW